MLRSSAIFRSVYQGILWNLPQSSVQFPKTMALNLPLTFSVQFTKAVLRSSAIFCSSSLRFCLKFSAILCPNYFRYVWKSSTIRRSIYLNYVEIFRNLPFCWPRYTLKSSAIFRSIPKPMALNLPLTFSVQFTKAVSRSSAIFRSSSLRYFLKSSAILRPNYFRYVWKSSLHYGMNCCMMLELFSNFPFKFT